LSTDNGHGHVTVTYCHYYGNILVSWRLRCVSSRVWWIIWRYIHKRPKMVTLPFINLNFVVLIQIHHKIPIVPVQFESQISSNSIRIFNKITKRIFDQFSKLICLIKPVAKNGKAQSSYFHPLTNHIVNNTPSSSHKNCVTWSKLFLFHFFFFFFLSPIVTKENCRKVLFSLLPSVPFCRIHSTFISLDISISKLPWR